jgi:hypothetical protein
MHGAALVTRVPGSRGRDNARGVNIYLFDKVEPMINLERVYLVVAIAHLATVAVFVLRLNGVF